VKHSHTTKILKWGLDAEHRFVGIEYGCTDCDAVSPTPWPVEFEVSEHASHVEYVDDCFACKAQTLELSTGDANSRRTMSKRFWNAEMNAYASAVREGLDPRTTNMADINAAKHAADKAGKPVAL
jgi:hypothetical protein